MSSRDIPVKLHWTCDLPSHYNAFLFRALSDAGFADLLVHYRHSALKSHPWKTELCIGYRSRTQKKLFGIDWVLIREVARNRGSLFVLGGWADATSLLLIFLCILLNRRYVLWTDTPYLDKKRNIVAGYVRNAVLSVVFGSAYAVMGTGRYALQVLSKMGVPDKKLINFPYWVPFPTERPASLSSVAERTLKFVSSGRVINDLKGHDLAMRALAKAYRRFPMARFEYSIAGSGPDVDSLIDLAGKLGIVEQVKFLGWVEPDNLAGLFNKSDVLIHPSPVHEPYGVAVAEAMAAGMVVLASDVTGAARDRIRPGVNGFIHAPRKVEELAEQIMWLVEHPDEIIRIGARARETAAQWPVSKGVEIVERLLK